jgi:hypothetical protein
VGAETIVPFSERIPQQNLVLKQGITMVVVAVNGKEAKPRYSKVPQPLPKGFRK